MDYIFRNKDIIFGDNDLEHLYTFKDFPVFMGCTDTNKSEDVLAEMSWKISKKSGIIQLNPLLPLEVVYSEEHGSGTIGKIWNEHHQAFAEFVARYEPREVLEIGGLHGVLAKKYLEIDSQVGWTMIDPNPIVDDSIPIRVIKGFFDDTFKPDKNFDTIIHSHVLEHVYQPEEFIKQKSRIMKEGDRLIFSVPNMKVMLENKYNNCINFEHTVYLRSLYIEYLLSRYGFEIDTKENFKKDHSIFYSATKNNTPNEMSLDFEKMYEENKKTFSEYISSHLEEVSKINKIINDTSKPVYLFGAHIFSQYLIAFGLNSDKIVKVLDNDAQKHNKRLYGTSLKVSSPKVLKGKKNAIVILRAGVYNEEIKKDIHENINPNIEFI